MNITSQRLSSAFLALFLISAPLVAAPPKHSTAQTGTAVFYSDKMDGQGTAMKGQKYDKNAMTAATHRRFPLGSTVRVTNLSNKKSVRVKVNDRMNPKSKAVIDLSRKAAEELGMLHNGHAKVRIQRVSSSK